MNKNWKKLIVALDLDERNEIIKVVKALSPQVTKFKIGPIAFTKFGPSLVKTLVKQGKDIFLDLKLHDIPNTMKCSAAVITELGCWAFTVHCKAGRASLLAVSEEVRTVARKKRLRKPLILGVTELTSSNASQKSVLKLAIEGINSGIDGIVASAWEAAAIKSAAKTIGKKILVVTPGIRGIKDSVGDQKRVATSKTAFKNGADYIVVGRPIISNKNYLQAAEDVLSC